MSDQNQFRIPNYGGYRLDYSPNLIISPDITMTQAVNHLKVFPGDFARFVRGNPAFPLLCLEDPTWINQFDTGVIGCTDWDQEVAELLAKVAIRTKQETVWLAFYMARMTKHTLNEGRAVSGIHSRPFANSIARSVTQGASVDDICKRYFWKYLDKASQM